MARSYNQITLVGHVGQQPDIRTTGSGKKVANLSIATSPPWDDDQVNWHKIVAWQKLADIIEQYVSKGDRVMIVGRLSYSSWTDDAGNNRKTPEVVADRMLMLGGNAPQKSGGGPGKNQQMPF
mgnify:CR=1 FL=1